MGIVRRDEGRQMEIEEFLFRRMPLSCAAAVLGRKGEENCYTAGRRAKRSASGAGDDEVGSDDDMKELVCVTSGVSFVGVAIVKQLLGRGYCVRVIVHNQEDVEEVREIQASGEMGGANDNTVEAVIADLTELQSVFPAINGCSAVFHTAAFVDPSGISGYSKIMGEIEVKVTRNILEACAATSSVRNCVLTSSLVACVWQDMSLIPSTSSSSLIIDHTSWSNESVCINKKLWYGLGKLRAEKAAWEFAKEKGVKLATICPGLITGPQFCHRNSTSTLAYLKGGREMYDCGLLATVDVKRLAKAHVCVYEEMKKTRGGGRYVCFDAKIESQEELQRLANETGLEIDVVRDDEPPINFRIRLQLSNLKLSALIHRTFRCNESSP